MHRMLRFSFAMALLGIMAAGAWTLQAEPGGWKTSPWHRCPKPSCTTPCDPNPPGEILGGCRDQQGNTWPSTVACCCCSPDASRNDYRGPK
jgi:hypothetical protein